MPFIQYIGKFFIKEFFSPITKSFIDTVGILNVTLYTLSGNPEPELGFGGVTVRPRGISFLSKKVRKCLQKIHLVGGEW